LPTLRETEAELTGTRECLLVLLAVDAAFATSRVCGHEKYCHNGAWPSPSIAAARGAVAFGGRNGLICFFSFHGGSKYCHNGGTGLEPSASRSR
jgi:hypothetical protein